MKRLDRINELLGKEFTTNTSGVCKVIGYENNRNVKVMFYEPAFVTTCETGDLRKGKVKNPLYPNVCGVGYIGIGEYSSKDVRAYCLWLSMLKRSYSEDFKTRFPSYKNVTVCEDWHNFQNFAKWCYSQPLLNAKDDKGHSYHLDKDILSKGNKIYSPETCCFVPREINNLYMEYTKNYGKVTTRVSVSNNGDKFKARIMILGKNVNLGQYDTMEEAVNSYNTAKKEHMSDVIQKWSGKIDEKVTKELVNTLLSFELCYD